MFYNFAQYKLEAITTIKEHASKEIALCDWTLGLVGEAGELSELIIHGCNDKMEFAKEAGDVLWYAAALFHELGVQPPADLFERELPTEFAGFADHINEWSMQLIFITDLTVMNATKVAEMVKHKIMHKEKFTVEQILEQVQLVVACVKALLHTLAIEVVDAAQLNVAKLQHRHNGAYSHATSADRHTREERFSDTAIYKLLEERICGN